VVGAKASHTAAGARWDLNPKPCTLNPIPYSLNPKPQTLEP